MKFINSKVFSFLVAIIILGSIVIIGNLSAKNRKKRILENPTLTNAQVLYVEYKNKQGYIINYEFYDSIKKVTGYVNGTNYKKIYRHAKNKKFPLIYNHKNSDDNFLLIFPEDFNSYNLSFPDSLKWVKEFR